MHDLARLGIVARVLFSGLRRGEESQRAARELGPQPQALVGREQRVTAEGGAEPRHAGVRKGPGRQSGGQHVEIGARSLEPAVHHRVGTRHHAAAGRCALRALVVSTPGVVVAERHRRRRARRLASDLPADAALFTGRQTHDEARHPWADVRGRRIEAHHGAAPAVVEPQVAEGQLGAVGHGRGQLAAPHALHAAQLEHVDIVGVQAQLDLELHRLAAIVREAHLLMARAVPQQLAAQHVNAALAQRDIAIAAQVGIHQLDGERAAVFLDRRIQMQRTQAVEQEQQVRQEAGVLHVETLLAALPRQDVAVAVEQRKHVVALERLQLPLDTRAGGQHIPASLDLDAQLLAHTCGGAHVSSLASAWASGRVGAAALSAWYTSR